MTNRRTLAWAVIAALVAGLGFAAPAAAEPEPLSRQQLLRTIGERQWHPRAAEVTFGGYVDGDGVAHLMFAPEDADVSSALQRTLGDRLVLSTGWLRQFTGGRANDASPHFGAARVSLTPLDTNGCTSAFSLVFPDNTRGSVTAAHCMSDHTVPESLFSGAQTYGFTDPDAATLGTYPDYDMIAIRPIPNHRFTNKIYTDPGDPIVRTVIGAGDPLVNDLVCTSGQLNKAKCDVRVRSVSGVFCHKFVGPNCVEQTNDLIVMSKPGVVVAFLGDSGGPVYTRLPQTGAEANGMIIGGEVLLDSNGNPVPKPGGLVFAEKISNILSNFNARVLTEP